MRLLTVAVSVWVSTLAFQSDKPRPDFRDHPVSIVYRGQPVPPIIPKGWRTYRTMIRSGANSSVEFAGHYTIPRWGCGAACNVFVVVDSKTGRVYDGLALSELPWNWLNKHGGDAMERMEFHPDSRLLKINACINEKDCGLYDYVMVEGKGLKLVRKELLSEEDE